MKVLMFSEQKNEKEHIGWYRDGKNISYFANGIKKSENSSKSLYTLTFTIEFPYSNDSVLLAYSYPYTYSDLMDVLSKIESDERKSEFCMRRTLCRTVAGNRCDYLTITAKDKGVDLSQRKVIVLSARVHPGETVGSLMMQGILDFLTDVDDKEAKLLRECFVFKVIPMLNPDGVINGNYRCSLAGCDLNRRWKTPSKTLHSTIYHAKQMILNLHSEKGVVFFCDLHGHSKKKDVFIYGCHDEEDPSKTRVFPMILSKICPLFSFEASKY
jgi:murein tripeptide amidase MpaA